MALLPVCSQECDKSADPRLGWLYHAERIKQNLPSKPLKKRKEKKKTGINLHQSPVLLLDNTRWLTKTSRQQQQNKQTKKHIFFCRSAANKLVNINPVDIYKVPALDIPIYDIYILEIFPLSSLVLESYGGAVALGAWGWRASTQARDEFNHLFLFFWRILSGYMRRY